MEEIFGWCSKCDAHVQLHEVPGSNLRIFDPLRWKVKDHLSDLTGRACGGVNMPPMEVCED